MGFFEEVWPSMKGTAECNAILTLFGSVFLYVIGYFVLPKSLAVTNLLYSQFGLIVSVVVIYFVTRHLAAGGVNTAAPSLKGKVCVVTGGASGIGLLNVREFARLGGSVILAARGDSTRLASAVKEAAEGLDAQASRNIKAMHLDLSSFSSIHTFVQEFLAQHTRLDILVNNAGVMMCPYSLTEDGLEMQIGTNHFGHFLLTNLLLDTLIASKARIVNLSSLAHCFVPRLQYPKQNDPKRYDKTVAYADSKLANIYFTTELQRRYGNKGIRAYSVHPGGVDTNLGRHFDLVTYTVMNPLKFFVWKTPQQGVQTSLFAALSDEAVPGAYHSDCKPWPMSNAAQDTEKAKWLWEESEKVTKIN